MEIPACPHNTSFPVEKSAAELKFLYYLICKKKAIEMRFKLMAATKRCH